MKNIFRPLVICTVLLTLAGCGLKGPLYFPPADKTTPPPTKPVDSGIQDSSPTRNDRGNADGPTQVNN